MTVKPFLKYAGGKRQLINVISQYLPDNYQNYYEPFIGGGALLFHLQPNKAIIGDINAELINCYQVVKNSRSELIKELSKHVNDKDCFYQVRSWDREQSYICRSTIEKASRIIYLNKTCFNGLYRVNSKGEFNTPFGRYKNPNITDIETLNDVSEYLNKSSLQILNVDFQDCLIDVRENDFVYLDPPYDVISGTANFTAYNQKGFNKLEHVRLKLIVDRLTSIGCKVLLINAYTEFIAELYKDYQQIEIKAKRTINCKANRRSEISEVLIKNYWLIGALLYH